MLESTTLPKRFTRATSTGSSASCRSRVKFLTKTWLKTRWLSLPSSASRSPSAFTFSSSVPGTSWLRMKVSTSSTVSASCVRTALWRKGVVAGASG